ncbi:hypothetical protein CEP54_014175 [Fusarium duplospermum]|uniref:Uncharacterized protein n=1 Tax=Fusarium duplospermum TaxID=1325734 RepID=A0A428NY12_9HYPO|nr:hypothetical protein CEP54_014175 [Fusarium duplospermum]
MSPEPSNTPETCQDDAPPEAAKTSSKGSSVANNLKNRRQEEERLIDCILPEAKNNPELYHNVVANLKSANISGPKRWRETGFVKKFDGWLDMAKEGDRPNLERLVTVLAIFDCYATNTTTKLRTGLARHRLREWAIRKLKGGRASTEQGTPETPRAPQKATKIKQETILPSIEIDQIDQIAPRTSFTTTQGLKRRAEDPPAEHLPKRTVSQADHDALVAKVARLNEALDAQQRRTSYRDFGIQTSPPSTETRTRLPSSVTEQLVKLNRTLAEHGRELVDLPSVVRDIVRQETHLAVHQEVQRAFVPMSGDTSMLQRSQGHGHSYSFYPNQPAPSYTFGIAREFQLEESPAPQGRAAGDRFNSRRWGP